MAKMMLNTQKRIAATILKCSPSKVVFDTEKLTEIKDALTKQDMRTLVESGVVKKARSNEQSRVRARLRAAQRSKGRQRGHGTRKGSANSRLPRKRAWIGKIRLQRSLLKKWREKKEISKKNYRDLYMKAKGGFFRSKRHVELYVSEHGMRKK